MPIPSSSERVDALLTEMTLAEKLGQLAMLTADLAVTGPMAAGDYMAAVRAGAAGSLLNLFGAERTHAAQRIAVEETRLGIPLFFGFDTLHGQRTVFPIPPAEAAAFDPELWRRTARAAAAEASADGLHLTFAPMLDIARDPRWGRMAESPGEDPWLASRYAAAKVEGFQGDDLSAADALAATAKHFVGYGAVGAGREYAPVELSERTLTEVHLPPFRAAVAAGAAAVMPAFNDLAGVPMSAHRPLLTGLLRECWGFTGLIISDYNAIAELVAHGVAADLADAAALALKAGVDVDMMADAYVTGLPVALERGTVTVATIDAAVRRVLAFKERLGLFDDPYRAAGDGLSARRRREHQALAREAARRSAVLLTNRDQTLPLKQGLRRLAVLGPLADSQDDMLGPWSAAGEAHEQVTPLAGLRAALPDARVEHAAGVTVDGDARNRIADACELAADADAVVLCLGEARWMSGEGGSRAHLNLPGRQAELASAVLDRGRPTVVVLFAGRPLLAPELFERADAVLAAWYLGCETGHALAELLTGAHNPSGRLPLSWPLTLGQVPVFFGHLPTGRPPTDSRYSSRYLDAPNEPLFPFGFGLSYTRFTLSDLRLSAETLRPGEVLTVSVEAANAGAAAGEHTVLLFTRDPVAAVSRPVLELKGTAKACLAPGERARLTFTLTTDDLTFPGPTLRPLLEPGEIEVLVGDRAERAALLTARLRVVAG